MQAALLAVVRPGNTPHGYNLTFAFPMLMFIIVAGALYLRFRGSHKVPGHVAITSSRWATSGDAGTVSFGDAAVHASVEPEAASEADAHASAVATAEAQGTTGSATPAEAGPAEPADRDTEDGE